MTNLRRILKLGKVEWQDKEVWEVFQIYNYKGGIAHINVKWDPLAVHRRLVNPKKLPI